MQNTNSKTCVMCSETKFLREFHKQPKNNGGYAHECKSCRKEFPSQTPAAVLARVAETRRRNRAFMWNFYSTHPCVDCGEDDPIVLELDHLDPDTKVMNVAAMAHGTYSIKKIQEEIDKCEVVCANCHRRRTALSQSWYLDHVELV